MPTKKHEDQIDLLIPIIIGVGAATASVLIISVVVLHFWVGWDLPFIAISNHESAAYWGQIGDFVGGLLNPVLSFVALMAVLYSVRMQRKELQLARGDARENYRVQIQQRQNFERQNFEAVFFRLLEIHARLVNELRIIIPLGYEDRTEVFQGRDAFEHIGNRLKTRARTTDECVNKVLQSVGSFETFHSRKCAHYFRNFYQILKHVESFGIDPLKMNRKYSFLFIRQLLQQYKAQRIYANILRAQLDTNELRVLFLNCLTTNGAGLKYYVERYSMLKHFDPLTFEHVPDTRYCFFDGLAFADGEEIRPEMLRDHYESVHKDSDMSASNS
ncbi:putative phage abortive infection protein [Pseudomonas syringae]|uniref:putative phage abortive infection protein n=1 Tax=Pseudomonas syringae TaxID=317 RepID=UPI001F107C5C|nr:putative phage abortive infection protein [Pseudomonas syringae]MCH5518972.1 putative phage abortive infection protein [Pseudomonas syringae pv. lapsa]